LDGLRPFELKNAPVCINYDGVMFATMERAMRVCLIATTLAAAALLATPVLAQRHADVVYLQQMKAKHAREMAENAKRKQEGEAGAPVAPVPAEKAKPSVPATARPTPPSTSN
jgi:hypothetical protein